MADRYWDTDKQQWIYPDSEVTDPLNAIAFAAIAYVNRQSAPFEKDSCDAWDRLSEAVEKWKASRIKTAELADGVVKEIEVS